MKMLIPSHAKKVQPYRDSTVPLFSRYHIETQLESMIGREVKLKSGEVIKADYALVAIGVQSNIENIGLEELGIITDQCAITINEFNQTNITTIYAIGDVSGPPWLAHVASAQGHVAADHTAGDSNSSYDSR